MDRFGERLPWWRALGAAALLSWCLISAIVERSDWPTPIEASWLLGELGLILALVTRRRWAAPLALGALVVGVVRGVDLALTWRWYNDEMFFGMAVSTLIAILVAPWRHTAITRTGAALACLSAACTPVWGTFAVVALEHRDGPAALPILAFAAFLIGGGAVLFLRARWGSLVLGLGAFACALGPMHVAPHGQLRLAALGAFAMMGAALLSWRDTHPGFRRTPPTAV